jgi:cyclophilin family peptidyl-prolyl cis-trans isomerase
MKCATHGFVLLLATFLSLVACQFLEADSIVQFSYSGVVTGGYSVQVYSTSAPIATATFLRYVNNGIYDNTILHRYDSSDGYTTNAMEGGGFQLDNPLMQDFYPTAAPLKEIVPYDAPDGEAGLSNVVGTIAMVKGGTPSSLTSKWDINITDNSALRDGTNYVVFGKVLAPGMTFLDSISLNNMDVSTYNLGPPDYPSMNDVPLYSTGSGSDYRLSFIVVSKAEVLPAAWKGGSNGTGDWGATSNWAGQYNNVCVPDGAGAKIALDNQTATAKTVDLTLADRTVGSITFTGDLTAITSSGQHKLTLDNNDQPAVIDVTGGHTISAPLVLGGDAKITGTGTLNATGGITGAHQLMVDSGTLNASSISVDSLRIGVPPLIIPPAEWKGGAAGDPSDWSLLANWTTFDGVPGAQGSQASFGKQTANYADVNLKSSDQTVGRLFFNDGTSTTITSSGGHTLTMDNGANVAEIEVAGTHTISVPVILADDLRISGPGTLHLSGGITGAFGIEVVDSTVYATSIAVDVLQISNTTPNAVPEPSVAALIVMCFAGLLALRRHRK